MKKNVPFLVAAILFSLTACSSHEADARKVFERANKLAFEGRSLEATSFGAAFEKYRAANARIAEIKEKYPETKFSQGLSQSSWQLGPFLWDRFSEEVLPEVKMKAIAESTPLACADHFAKKLKEDFERVETLSYLAGAAYQDGDGVRGERLISQAEKACEKLPRKGDEVMNSLEDGKLAIAQAALKAGQIERAKGIIEKYGLKDLLAAELALALVARGNPEEAVRIVDESNNRDSLEITVLAKSAVLLSRAGKREGAAALLERAEKSLKALVYSVGMPASSLDEAKTDLALGFCENKETARVLLLFGPHWVPGFFLSSAPALDELYKCCQEQGIASSILRSADQAISPLPEEKMDLAQLSERSISLGNLAYLQWKLGEQKKGRENLAEALRIEKKIGPPFSDSPDDRYRKAEAVLNLVNICQRIGFESEALDELSVVFRLVKEAPPYPSEFDKRDGTMIDLAMAYARSGKISECQSSIQALRSNSSLCAAMVQLQPLFKASKERGNYGKLLHALVASGLGVQ